MGELSRAAMAGKTIADAIKAQGDAAKAGLLELMDTTGAERVRVTGDDGTDYGTVTRSPGRAGAKITDPVAYLAWVAERYPEQIVQAVNPAFTDRLLAGATRKDAPVDDQGEVVPGLELTQGAAYLSVRPTAIAKERAQAVLTGRDPLALTS